jgi:hypothetical protein
MSGENKRVVRRYFEERDRRKVRSGACGTTGNSPLTRSTKR